MAVDDLSHEHFVVRFNFFLTRERFRTLESRTDVVVPQIMGARQNRFGLVNESENLPRCLFPSARDSGGRRRERPTLRRQRCDGGNYRA